VIAVCLATRGVAGGDLGIAPFGQAYGEAAVRVERYFVGRLAQALEGLRRVLLCEAFVDPTVGEHAAVEPRMRQLV
jgi:hypothetical protein